MTRMKSQDVAQLTLQEKLRILGQPKYVYDELAATDAENQLWVEGLLNTILTKGYLPA